MRQLGILTAVALTLTVGATSRAGGPGDKDKEQLQGTWTLTNLAYDGKDVPLPAGKTVTLTFTGDKVAFKDDGDKAPQEGTFKLVSGYKPEGDQPQAIEALVRNIQENLPHQVLLGVTGSGKTFTMANIIA